MQALSNNVADLRIPTTSGKNITKTSARIDLDLKKKPWQAQLMSLIFLQCL